MLGKLFKHEFKDTGKLLLPLNLALIGVTLLGMLLLNLGVSNINNNGYTMPVLMIITTVVIYVLAIIALYIVTYIYLMMRFYRSMYSDEGYLTRTLPVSSFTLLNTKVFVSAFWCFITLLLTIVSIFALIYSAATATGDFSLTVLTEAFPELEAVLGISISSIIGWTLLYMLITSFSGILMIYCSISIGQLFNKHKVGASIVTYIIIYIIVQIVNTLVSFAQGFNMITDVYDYAYYDATSITVMDIYGSTFSTAMIVSAIFMVLYYITCAYINHKHVNLD